MRTAENLKVKMYANRKLMGEAAAAQAAQCIKKLLAQQPFVNIVFAAAPSQNEFLAALSETDIDWFKVNAFHMDEYIGLAEEAPQRFSSFLKNALFDKVTFNSVHLLNGNAANMQEECKRYAGLLQQWKTDIACMGIGENGHLAFNDPSVADFNDKQWVKIVTLDDVCRQQQVNDGCFKTLSDVPREAVTLTIPALMAARNIYCVVPGERKAAAVFNTINKEISERHPSAILRKHDNAVLFLDLDSSRKCNF